MCVSLALVDGHTENFCLGLYSLLVFIVSLYLHFPSLSLSLSLVLVQLQVFGGQDGNTQADVFKDTKHLIMSVVDGYNVCIFAYGQTGAGKVTKII